MATHWLLILFAASLFSHAVSAQALPDSLKRYLDRNFRGWKLAGECYEKESDNKRVLVADFDGNGKRDYAVKFTRGDKGFLMAFLASGRRWKPFYLHIWEDPEEARFSDLVLFNKGESYEPAGTPKFRFDSPADFRCESDVGGVHSYRNRKFIAY